MPARRSDHAPRASVAALLALPWLLAPAGPAAPHAAAQVASPVYADDSVAARDGLARAAELLAAGNTAAAAALLQRLIENEGSRVIATADAQLYVSVRQRVNQTIASSPELLAAYRDAEGPAAERLLRDNPAHEPTLQAIERDRLLTTAGFRAAAILAHRHALAGRFWAARLTLDQLDTHPDASARPAPEASAAAAIVAAGLGTDEARAWSRRWADSPATGATPGSGPASPPAVTGFDPQPLPDFDALGPDPLQSAELPGPEAERRASGVDVFSTPGAGLTDSPIELEPWALPVMSGDAVLVNDGAVVSALDRFTLGPRWTVRAAPSGPALSRDPVFDAGTVRMMDDSTTVAVSPWGVAVAATGLSQMTGPRAGDAQLMGIDAASGRVLWTRSLLALGPAMDDAGLRGPAALDADTAVITLRRTSSARRVATTVMAGLDAFDGSLRWTLTLASTGIMAYQQQMRAAEWTIAVDGIAYRSDELGAVVAVEAHSGRVRWLRTIPAAVLWPAGGELGPWAGGRPIIDGERLIVMDGARQIILALDRRTGRILASRQAGELGMPKYLVRVGAWLAAVGPERLAFVPLDRFAEAAPTSAVPGAAGAPGRAVALGGFLALPSPQGLQLFDPAAPDRSRLIRLASTGNLLASEDHLLVADSRRLSSFLTWERASAMLERTLAQNPGDPSPAVTYAELSLRAGRPERALDAADRALAIFAADAVGDRFPDERRRLFDLLLESVSAGLDALEAPDGKAAAGSVRPVRDAGVLASLGERLWSLADSIPQRVSAELLAARLAEARRDPAQAVEIYQRLLLDPALRAAPVRGEGVLPAPAGERAASRLRELVLASGAGVYAPFDADASRQLQALRQGPGGPDAARAAEALGETYPVAAAAPEAFLWAADQWLAASEPRRADRALSAALRSGETLVAVGRADALAPLAESAGRLLERLEADASHASALRVLARLEAASPGLAPTVRGSPLDQVSLRQRLADALSQASRRPDIGQAIAPQAQVIEGWVIQHARFDPEWPGYGLRRPTDAITMLNMPARRFGLATADPGGGPVRIAWSRPFDQSPPDILRATTDTIVIFWPGARGGRLEKLDAVTGRTLWSSPELEDMLAQAPGPQRAGEAPPWPEPGLAGGELLVAASDRSFLIGRRDGAVIAIDMDRGQALWTDTRLSRLRDLALGDGHAVLVGDRSGAGDTTHHAHFLDEKTGQTVRVFDLPSSPDAVRMTDAGLAVVNTGRDLVAYTHRAAQPVWSLTDLPTREGRFVDLWLAGDTLLAMERSGSVWFVRADTGAARREPVDTRRGLGANVRASALPSGVVLRGSAGLLVLDAQGRTVGASALDNWGPLLPPEPARSAFVAVTRDLHAVGARVAVPNGDQDFDPRRAARIALLDPASAKLLAAGSVELWEDPQTLAVLDGKILVSTSFLTVVLDAPR